jgi:16S rRNA (uracil1498-N3)-methyltransferase
MQLFFCDNLQGPSAELNEEESRHCKVLRKQIGDEILVIDGQGTLATCRIVKFQGKDLHLDILGSEKKSKTRNYYFHLYIAPTKQNDRIEWMFEKAVEAGLDEITFIETEHSEKNRINISRLDRIALSAVKQSAQFYLPKINPLVKLNAIQFDDTFLVAHCNEDETKLSLVDAIRSHKQNTTISILIGPEGDFSNTEIEKIIQKNVRAISLGNNRLRTETAGLYCAMVLNASL